MAMNEEPSAVLSQRLSVMFMVLAIGSLMDTRLPSYNVEAEKVPPTCSRCTFPEQYLRRAHTRSSASVVPHVLLSVLLG
jgi:hypothetical protein